MKKRLIALLCTLAMLCSMFPVQAFAAEGTPVITRIAEVTKTGEDPNFLKEDEIITVTQTLKGPADLGLFGFQFDVTYDPEILAPEPCGADDYGDPIYFDGPQDLLSRYDITVTPTGGNILRAVGYAPSVTNWEDNLNRTYFLSPDGVGYLTVKFRVKALPDKVNREVTISVGNEIISLISREEKNAQGKRQRYSSQPGSQPGEDTATYKLLTIQDEISGNKYQVDTQKPEITIDGTAYQDGAEVTVYYYLQASEVTPEEGCRVEGLETLEPGIHVITVTDPAGNTTTVTLTINTDKLEQVRHAIDILPEKSNVKYPDEQNITNARALYRELYGLSPKACESLDNIGKLTDAEGVINDIKTQIRDLNSKMQNLEAEPIEANFKSLNDVQTTKNTLYDDYGVKDTDYDQNALQNYKNVEAELGAVSAEMENVEADLKALQAAIEDESPDPLKLNNLDKFLKNYKTFDALETAMKALNAEHPTLYGDGGPDWKIIEDAKNRITELEKQREDYLKKLKKTVDAIPDNFDETERAKLPPLFTEVTQKEKELGTTFDKKTEIKFLDDKQEKFEKLDKKRDDAAAALENLPAEGETPYSRAEEIRELKKTVDELNGTYGANLPTEHLDKCMSDIVTLEATIDSFNQAIQDLKDAGTKNDPAAAANKIENLKAQIAKMDPRIVPGDIENYDILTQLETEVKDEIEQIRAVEQQLLALPDADDVLWTDKDGVIKDAEDAVAELKAKGLQVSTDSDAWAKLKACQDALTALETRMTKLVQDMKDAGAKENIQYSDVENEGKLAAEKEALEEKAYPVQDEDALTAYNAYNSKIAGMLKEIYDANTAMGAAMEEWTYDNYESIGVDEQAAIVALCSKYGIGKEDYKKAFSNYNAAQEKREAADALLEETEKAMAELAKVDPITEADIETVQELDKKVNALKKTYGLSETFLTTRFSEEAYKHYQEASKKVADMTAPPPPPPQKQEQPQQPQNNQPESEKKAANKTENTAAANNAAAVRIPQTADAFPLELTWIALLGSAVMLVLCAKKRRQR